MISSEKSATFRGHASGRGEFGEWNRRRTPDGIETDPGAGIFGGMLPLLTTAIVAATGNIYNGLWYPILVAVMTAVVGSIWLRDTKDVDIRLGPGVEAAQHA
jgi:hypothetical protein